MNLVDTLLALLFLLGAALYAAVGHGGASSYLAIMALAGLEPALMRPTALILNVAVSGIALWRFSGVGAFQWRLFWPLAACSIPFAFIGGLLVLPGHWYQPLVGLVLLYAAGFSLRQARQPQAPLRSAPPLLLMLLIGAGLGLLSGLTGVGGGIFLSPLLLMLRWAPLRTISGIAAAFVLVNSLAGLAGVLSSGATLPGALPLWLLAVIIGGSLGAHYGSRRLQQPALRRTLAVVLAIAGGKMILG